MKQMNNFDLGDVVVLKSGGPKMTIFNKIYQGQVNVKWFNVDGKVDTALFPVECLILAVELKVKEDRYYGKYY